MWLLLVSFVVNNGSISKKSGPLNLFKEMGIPDHLICLLRNLYAGQEATVRTEHGTTDWFRIGKGLCQGCKCHPVYFTYMQSTSCKMLDWIKHTLESRLKKYQQPQICRWHHPYGRKQRITKEPLDESEKGGWKSWLKIQHSEILRSWHLVPSFHG